MGLCAMRADVWVLGFPGGEWGSSREHGCHSWWGKGPEWKAASLETCSWYVDDEGGMLPAIRWPICAG